MHIDINFILNLYVIYFNVELDVIDAHIVGTYMYTSVYIYLEYADKYSIAIKKKKRRNTFIHFI